MRSLIVVVAYPLVNSRSEFPDVVGRKEIDILMFDGSPEALYPDIVITVAASVHGYLDVVPPQEVLPFRRGVLPSLVRVDYLRGTVYVHAFLQQIVPVERGKSVTQATAKHIAAIDIYNIQH